MRINNALHWYLPSNLASQLNCTWQANLKEHITVWVSRGKGYRSPYETGVSAACMNQSAESEATSYQISDSTRDVRERTHSSCGNRYEFMLANFQSFCRIMRWWFVWPTFHKLLQAEQLITRQLRVRLKNDLLRLTERERVSRMKCKRITPLYSTRCRCTGGVNAFSVEIHTSSAFF